MSTKRLIDLYTKISKHSQYQQLASALSTHIPNKEITVRSRFEQERLKFILERLEYRDATIADIGGNTGFFTIELIANGAKAVTFIEANKEHCDFVAQSLRLLGKQNNVEIHQKTLQFVNDTDFAKADICLLLNVLHHIGDDFGEHNITTREAKSKIIEALKQLSLQSKHMAFQIGFNWKGNTNFPLFPLGTKSEVIEYVKRETEGFWEVESIGIAEKHSCGIIYKEVNQSNIHRNDSLGEFLNRPLFIMKSVQP